MLIYMLAPYVGSAEADILCLYGMSFTVEVLLLIN